MAGVELYSWSMEIYGCPSDNRISIFGCPATFLVVPGARTTKFSNAAQEWIDQQFSESNLLLYILILPILRFYLVRQCK